MAGRPPFCLARAVTHDLPGRREKFLHPLRIRQLGKVASAARHGIVNEQGRDVLGSVREHRFDGLDDAQMVGVTTDHLTQAAQDGGRQAGNRQRIADRHGGRQSEHDSLRGQRATQRESRGVLRLRVSHRAPWLVLSTRVGIRFGVEFAADRADPEQRRLLLVTGDEAGFPEAGHLAQVEPSDRQITHVSDAEALTFDVPGIGHTRWIDVGRDLNRKAFTLAFVAPITDGGLVTAHLGGDLFELHHTQLLCNVGDPSAAASGAALVGVLHRAVFVTEATRTAEPPSAHSFAIAAKVDRVDGDFDALRVEDRSRHQLADRDSRSALVADCAVAVLESIGVDPAERDVQLHRVVEQRVVGQQAEAFQRRDPMLGAQLGELFRSHGIRCLSRAQFALFLVACGGVLGGFVQAVEGVCDSLLADAGEIHLLGPPRYRVAHSAGHGARSFLRARGGEAAQRLRRPVAQPVEGVEEIAEKFGVRRLGVGDQLAEIGAFFGSLEHVSGLLRTIHEGGRAAVDEVGEILSLKYLLGVEICGRRSHRAVDHRQWFTELRQLLSAPRHEREGQHVAGESTRASNALQVRSH